MKLFIHVNGTLQAIYDDKMPLFDLGDRTIKRAAHVEPDDHGYWWIHFQGEKHGPFTFRTHALEYETRIVNQRLANGPT